MLPVYSVMDWSDLVFAFRDHLIQQRKMLLQLIQSLDTFVGAQIHYTILGRLDGRVVLNEQPYKVQTAWPSNVTNNEQLVDIPFYHRRKWNAGTKFQVPSEILPNQTLVWVLERGYQTPRILSANC